MFCLDTFAGWPSGSTRWMLIDYDLEGGWPCVPCGIVHGAGSPLTCGERTKRIGVWWWCHLRPTRAGGAFRAQGAWEGPWREPVGASSWPDSVPYELDRAAAGFELGPDLEWR